MHDFLTVADAKDEAKAILQTLRELNPETEIPLGHCLELLARRNGYKNWRAFKLALEPDASEETEEKDPGAFGRVPLMTHESLKAEIARNKRRMNIALTQPVTDESYAAAVSHLVEVTRMRGTSGARACAVLLLSLYNGHEWHMDLTDLCVLDLEIYASALIAVRGRTELMKEPHRMIEGGSDILNDLWDRYRHLSVAEVWKPECRSCEGRGETYDDNGEPKGLCQRCDGHGYVNPIDDLVTALRQIRDLPSGTDLSAAQGVARSALLSQQVYD